MSGVSGELLEVVSGLPVRTLRIGAEISEGNSEKLCQRFRGEFLEVVPGFPGRTS